MWLQVAITIHDRMLPQDPGAGELYFGNRTSFHNAEVGGQRPSVGPLSTGSVRRLLTRVLTRILQKIIDGLIAKYQMAKLEKGLVDKPEPKTSLSMSKHTMVTKKRSRGRGTRIE